MPWKLILKYPGSLWIYTKWNNELTYKGTIFISVGKWDSACHKTHFDVLGKFAFSFFKNYTVKCLDKEYSDSQSHSKYISIKRMS